nr:acyltransferase [Candidatus Nanopelagicales bacterium]
RETSDNDAFLIVAALVVSLGSLFAMGLFFLIAGLLTPRSLAKKGTGGFLRDRVVRLGVPFLAYLVIYPLVVWLAGDEGWREVLADQARELTPGPLWFVLVLLIYSACYAWWRRGHAARSDGGALRPRLLVLLGALIAASTVVVRLVFPINSDQVFSLHLWQWPQCLGLFVLGVMCAENGWADPVADRLRRGCGFSALAGVVVMVGAFAASPESFEPFAGGLQWQALLTCVRRPSRWRCRSGCSASSSGTSIGRVRCGWRWDGPLSGPTSCRCRWWWPWHLRSLRCHWLRR